MNPQFIYRLVSVEHTRCTLFFGVERLQESASVGAKVGDTTSHVACSRLRCTTTPGLDTSRVNHMVLLVMQNLDVSALCLGSFVKTEGSYV